MLKLPDKNTSWNYQYGSLPVDLSSIIQEVKSFENEWLLDTSRQDKLATHKDTKMFQLRFMSYHWEFGQGNTSYDINYFKNCSQINEKLGNLLNIFGDLNINNLDIEKLSKLNNIENSKQEISTEDLRPKAKPTS